MTCTACRMLPFQMQCNNCRTERPNAKTLLHNRIAKMCRETACSVTEAEAAFGVTAGPTFGG